MSIEADLAELFGGELEGGWIVLGIQGTRDAEA